MPTQRWTGPAWAGTGSARPAESQLGAKPVVARAPGQDTMAASASSGTGTVRRWRAYRRAEPLLRVGARERRWWTHGAPLHLGLWAVRAPGAGRVGGRWEGGAARRQGLWTWPKAALSCLRTGIARRDCRRPHGRVTTGALARARRQRAGEREAVRGAWRTAATLRSTQPRVRGRPGRLPHRPPCAQPRRRAPARRACCGIRCGARPRARSLSWRRGASRFAPGSAVPMRTTTERPSSVSG